MHYLYVDESGEFGSKEGSSAHFVVTALSTEHPKALNKRVKKYKASLYNMGWPQNIEIKGTSLWSSPHNPRIPKAISEKRKDHIIGIISEICASPIKIHYSVAKKSELSDHLRQAEYGIAYNYLCGKLICRAYEKHYPGPLDIVVDQRSKETHSKMKFDGYLETRLVTECRHTGDLTISHRESDQTLGLQAVDFLSWSIFRHYEHRDSSFRDVLKTCIGYRDDWYSWKK